jgi:RNA polymerase sigma-70 factor (ECF subfamily)
MIGIESAPMSPLSSGGISSPTPRHLLARARLGDSTALGQLVSRCLPQLHRWAHGRLRRCARAAADTSDFIQDAVLHTIRRLHTFELRGQDALAAYLRQAVQNRIRDEYRRVARHGTPAALSEALVDPAPSPVDRAITGEMEVRYRTALRRLSPTDRELIVAHVELDYTHDQLGCMTGRSPNAARMALKRAVRRLLEQMHDG